ncbi:MAG TPA: hypothetical protein VH439_17425 [Gemmatimonadales bacterium]|jgi:hypothetical protein
MPDGAGSGGLSREEMIAAARAAFDKYLARHGGNALKAARAAIEETNDLRQKNAALEVQLTEMKKKLPADGAVVLSPEDAKKWEGFKLLEAEPKELAELLDAYEALQAKEEQREFTELVTQAAADLGWNKHALVKLLDGAEVALRDVVVQDAENGSRTEQLLHVRAKDADDKTPWELVDQYVARTNKEWLPILESVAVERDDDESEGETTETEEEPVSANGENGRDDGRRRNMYRAAGAKGGRSTDGVRFPAQRNPAPRGSRLTRAQMQELAEAKNRQGEYNSF